MTQIETEEGLTVEVDHGLVAAAVVALADEGWRLDDYTVITVRDPDAAGDSYGPYIKTGKCRLKCSRTNTYKLTFQSPSSPTPPPPDKP